MQREKLLDNLWACLIDDIQHNYQNAELLIKLREPETEKTHILLFHGVVSLLWTMMGVEGEINREVYPEMTSVLLRDVIISTKDRWLKSYPKQFNVCIEIMDRALLVSAEAFTLDEFHFTLK